MKLILKRYEKSQDGVFGKLVLESGEDLCFTLEHAYLCEHEYFPKVNPGEYTCKRGTHCLHNGVPFETFEVTGVEGHTNILLHAGNYNKDSEGCILLGTGKLNNMITNSQAAFGMFLRLMEGLDEFTLVVE